MVEFFSVDIKVVLWFKLKNVMNNENSIILATFYIFLVVFLLFLYFVLNLIDIVWLLNQYLKNSNSSYSAAQISASVHLITLMNGLCSVESDVIETPELYVASSRVQFVTVIVDDEYL